MRVGKHGKKVFYCLSSNRLSTKLSVHICSDMQFTGALMNKFDGFTFINNLFCGQQLMIAGLYEKRSLSDRATVTH